MSDVLIGDFIAAFLISSLLFDGYIQIDLRVAFSEAALIVILEVVDHACLGVD